MAGTSSLRLLAARLDQPRNSAVVEEALRLLRNGLAHGDEQAVLSQCSAWMGREEAAKQIRTAHRLSADVLLRLAVPDPAALKRKKLEAKIARLNDELRRLALPPIPKSEGLGEDVPIGAKTARRAS